jgi:hypothetical protein
MESAGYVIIYFCKGRLPWQGMRAATKKQRYERICEAKMIIPLSNLCLGLAPEIKRYMEVHFDRVIYKCVMAQTIVFAFQYVRQLSFSERPDYSALKGMFVEALMSRGELDDGIYDWTPSSAAQSMRVGVPVLAGEEE